MSGVRTSEDHGAPAAALLLVIALVAVVFFDILFRGQVLFERDIHVLLWAQCASFANVVREGAWPLWNPFLGFGRPMLADPGAQVLYPLTWLNLLVRPEDYSTLYAVGHLLLAGVGMVWLGRTLRLSWKASAVATAAWMLSGPLLSAVDLWQHFAGAAWMPWVVAGASRALAQPSGRRVLAWAVVQSAQVLSGSLDMVVLTALPQTGLLMARLSWRRPLSRGNARRLLAGATAALLAVGWTAALWVPALDLLGRTVRAQQPAAERMMWSVRPIQLLQGLLPLFPQDLPVSDAVRTYLWEGREPLLTSLYLGLPAFALALAAICSGRRRLVAGLSGLVAVSVLLALGRHGLVYAWAMTILPPLELLRFPVKATLPAALGYGLLVGVGLDALWEGRVSRRAGAVLAGLIGVGGTLALLGAHQIRSAGESLLAPTTESPLLPGAADAVLAVVVWSGSAALVTAGLVALAGSRAPRPLAGAVAAVAVLDLLIVHRGVNPTAPSDVMRETPPAVQLLLRDGARRVHVFDYLLTLVGREPLLPERPAALARLPRARIRIIEARAYPGLLPRWNLGGSYEPDVVGLESREAQGLRLLLVAVERNPRQLLRLLRVGGVGHVVAQHREGLEVLEPLAKVAHSTARDVHVYRVPAPLPRASAVAGSRIARGLESYQLLLDPGFDPEATVILPSGEDRPPLPRFSWRIEIAEERADRLRLRAVVSSPGFVLVPEGYDPGWKATVDGRDAPVLRANLAFRAVPLPAGTHEVQLVYRPASVTRGLSVSGLTILLTFVGLGLGRFPRPAAPGRPASAEPARETR